MDNHCLVKIDSCSLPVNCDDCYEPPVTTVALVISYHVCYILKYKSVISLQANIKLSQMIQLSVNNIYTCILQPFSFVTMFQVSDAVLCSEWQGLFLFVCCYGLQILSVS